MAWPSTFADLQNRVALKLRLESPQSIALIPDWINQAYAKVCIETEATQTIATMTLTAGAASYTLPLALIRMKTLVVQPVGQSSYWAPLEEVTLEQMYTLRYSTGTAAAASTGPTHYCIPGQMDIEFWPTPASADTVQAYYVYQPTALSEPDDTLVLTEPYGTECVEYGALAEAADFLGDANNEIKYRQLSEERLQRFRQHLNRRRGAHTTQLPLHAGTRPVVHDNSADVRGW